MIKTNKRPAPLAPPPIISQSRKKARITTTLFHKYSRQRDAALQRGESTKHWDTLLEEIGGRREYQRASQISTSFHSTSKWVLGYLAQKGWIYGIPVVKDDEHQSNDDVVSPSSSTTSDDQPKLKKSLRKAKVRRQLRVLEIGAINTELIDAAKNRNNNMNVRAIDLHSMHEEIEEADFLCLSLPCQLYDVIVCSMVVNCIPNAADRGKMMTRLYHFTNPGGLVFLTIPKTCLNLSPYMDLERFHRLVQTVGLEIKEHTKNSPKVAYFILKRPIKMQRPVTPLEQMWKELTIIRQGKKYQNDFAVTLTDQNITGSNLLQEKATNCKA